MLPTIESGSKSFLFAMAANNSFSGARYFGKRLERDSESMRHPMEVWLCAVAASRRPAAYCGFAATPDSGVGRSAGEPRSVASGSSSTTKLHPCRCAGNSALPGWKCRKNRAPGSRNSACGSQRPTRHANGVLPSPEGDQLVYAVHQWAGGEADDAQREVLVGGA